MEDKTVKGLKQDNGSCSSGSYFQEKIDKAERLARTGRLFQDFPMSAKDRKNLVRERSLVFGLGDEVEEKIEKKNKNKQHKRVEDLEHENPLYSSDSQKKIKKQKKGLSKQVQDIPRSLPPLIEDKNIAKIRKYNAEAGKKYEKEYCSLLGLEDEVEEKEEVNKVSEHEDEDLEHENPLYFSDSQKKINEPKKGLSQQFQLPPRASSPLFEVKKFSKNRKKRDSKMFSFLGLEDKEEVEENYQMCSNKYEYEVKEEAIETVLAQPPAFNSESNPSDSPSQSFNEFRLGDQTFSAAEIEKLAKAIRVEAREVKQEVDAGCVEEIQVLEYDYEEEITGESQVSEHRDDFDQVSENEKETTEEDQVFEHEYKSEEEIIEENQVPEHKNEEDITVDDNECEYQSNSSDFQENTDVSCVQCLLLERALQKSGIAHDAVSNKNNKLEAQLQKALQQKRDLSKILQRERDEKEALERTLRQELAEKDTLSWTLQNIQNERDTLSKTLQNTQDENDALSKTLQKEIAANDSLCAEMELLKTEVVELKKSKTKLEQRKAQMKGTITKMIADLEESKKVIEKLKNDLEASASQHQEERAEREESNCVEIKVLKKELDEQQKESLRKDSEIQSLHFNIQSLQSNIEVKDSTVSSLQEKVNQLALDLKEERTKTSKLQRDYKAAVSKQQEEAEKLSRLSQEIQKQPLKEGEAGSRLEEAMSKEKAHSAKADEMSLTQKELFEKTLALERSLAAEKYLKSALKRETKRLEKVVLQKQAAVDPLTILGDQLKEASSYSQRLIYDMQTLRMENADILAKFKVTEAEYGRLKSEHCSLSKRYEEMICKNDETISQKQLMLDELKEQHSESRIREKLLEDALKQEKAKVSELQQQVDQISSDREEVKTKYKRIIFKACSFYERYRGKMLEKDKTVSEQQSTIAKLQCMVDELKAQQSEIRTKDAALEDALINEKAKTSELQQKVDQISALLEKESNRCKKYHVKFKEALSKQKGIQEEKRKLAVAPQRVGDSHTSLEDSKALHSLQKEYTDLVRRHNDVNDDYCELLKTLQPSKSGMRS